MDALTGKIIKGYEIRELLNAGGFGEVYRAYQMLVGREVAIKVILPIYANQPEFIRRFEIEAHLIARLEHFHIVPLHDFWREPDGAYLVMRFLRGGSLKERLATERPLPDDDIEKLFIQIGAALAAAHRYGVIHRNLKPANLLFDEDDNAYLTDFGIAKDLLSGDDSQTDQAGVVLGTPRYFSPEQARNESISPQTDIYSLGILLYECLTGKHPFHEAKGMGDMMLAHLQRPMPSILTLRPDLPPITDSVLQMATAKDPTARFASMSAFNAYLPQIFAPSNDSTSVTFILAQTPTGFTDATLLANPYKGLQAFDEADQADFFGREHFVEKLLRRLVEEHPFQRFLAVVGPSGSGKSSVVRAGLLPALRAGGVAASAGWFMTRMIPGEHPFEELESALLRVAVNPPTSLLEQLIADERGLIRALKRILPDENTELCLFIDQFEEIFTLVNAENIRALFLRSLYYAIADSRSQIRVIITLRADFYDRPLFYAQFGELLRERMETILPLSSEAIERAIKMPAERIGIRLEQDLVAAIIGDVNEQPGTLPLLQYALTELFEQRTKNILTSHTYETIGGVLGALTRRADQVYQNLSENQQVLAPQLFLRLVTLGEGTEDTRRRVLLRELQSIGGADMVSVIERFGESRLLTFDRDPITRQPTIEVAHEALLRQWERLRQWLNESRDTVRLQRQLNTLAEAWIKAQRDESYLLHGVRLGQFESWASQTSMTLTPNEQTYLNASIMERQRQLTLEQKRLTHERQLEQRTRRVLQLLVGIFLLASIVGAVLAGIALRAESEAEQAQNRSEREADYARSLALAANSNQALQEGQADLALLLALEAAHVPNPPPATWQSLSDAAYAPQYQQEFAADVHQLPVSDIAFSPDGKLVATADEAGRIIIWEVATWLALHTLNEHQDVVNEIAFNPAGNRLVSVPGQFISYLAEVDASTEQTPFVWNVENGRIHQRLIGHQGAVTALAFSPTGELIATASLDQTIRLWDSNTGQELQRFTPYNFGPIHSLSISTTGLLAMAGDDHLVRLWDIASQQEIKTLRGHSDIVNRILFSPDGTTLISGAQDRTILIWDVATGHIVGRLPKLNDEIRDFEVDFERQQPISLSGNVEIWDLTTLQRLYMLTDRPISTLALSPDGTRLLMALTDNARQSYAGLLSWDVSNGYQLAQWGTTEHRGGIQAVSANDEFILSGSSDKSLIVWDAQTYAFRAQLTGHTGVVREVVLEPTGKTALSLAKELIYWDLVTFTEQKRYSATDLEHNGDLSAFALSPDGTILVTGAEDGSLYSWQNGQRQQVLSSGGEAISQIAFSPDGQWVASLDTANHVQVWEVATGKRRHNMLAPTKLTTLALNAAMILGGGQKGELYSWSMDDGQLRYSLFWHQNQVSQIAFLTDETYVLSSSYDGTVLLWDIGAGKLLVSFQDDGAGITSFTQIGQRLISASTDRHLVAWRLLLLPDLLAWIEANRPLREFTCQEHERYSIAPLCN